MPTAFAHINLIAHDWRRLMNFYCEVFGCVPVPPERDLSGEWIDRAVGLEGVRIRGMHLRLPGYGDHGPTIELFQYGSQPDTPPTTPDRPGFSHIAFAVDNVTAAVELAFLHGGQAAGELTVRHIEGAGKLTFQYLYDPEGNIIELQHWG